MEMDVGYIKVLEKLPSKDKGNTKNVSQICKPLGWDWNQNTECQLCNVCWLPWSNSIMTLLLGSSRHHHLNSEEGTKSSTFAIFVSTV
jgi:hypothetical protein